MTDVLADAALLEEISALDRTIADLKGLVADQRGVIRALRDDLASAQAARDIEESASELMREVYEVFGGDCWNDSAVTKTWAARARATTKRIARILDIKEQK